jgi:hypothetical protein
VPAGFWRGCRGRDRMVVEFITTNVLSLNPVHGKVYSLQHYVIKFVSANTEKLYGRNTEEKEIPTTHIMCFHYRPLTSCASITDHSHHVLPSPTTHIMFFINLYLPTIILTYSKKFE